MDSPMTINTMEVLETKPLNELVTEATIKVCWVGDEANPNETIIDREAGKQIAATLPGAPVAGFFNKETGDFEEHSRRVTIKNGEIQFEDLTKPYGFVSPMDVPWYQDFVEEGTTRTYLMCKAFLWTRQYEEASLALNKGQSMELDEKTMSGYYKGSVFVFTDLALEKLCILGDSFAPCFSGAKIMATYTKQYTSLAEQLENTIGRRYYVMQGKLVEKPKEGEKVALSYAVQLGWNLTDAVWNQLATRGADNYDVEGIFADGDEIFAILCERETLEQVKVALTINSDSTVELAAEMQAVTMVWVPKDPAPVTPVENLSGDSAVIADQNPIMNVSTGFSLEGGGNVPTGEGTTEAAVTTVATAEGTATATDAGTENGVATAMAVATEGSAASGTETTDVTNPTGGLDTAEAGEAEVAPEIDYVAECERLTTISQTYADEITALKAQNTELQTKVENQETIIAAYHANEADTINQQKAEVVDSYASLLSEEEIAPVKEQLDTLSVDDVEAKLAVTYARKQKQNPATNYQVDVSKVTPNEPDLPDFIKQAMEIDQRKAIKL